MGFVEQLSYEQLKTFFNDLYLPKKKSNEEVSSIKRYVNNAVDGSSYLCVMTISGKLITAYKLYNTHLEEENNAIDDEIWPAYLKLVFGQNYIRFFKKEMVNKAMARIASGESQICDITYDRLMK